MRNPDLLSRDEILAAHAERRDAEEACDDLRKLLAQVLPDSEVLILAQLENRALFEGFVRVGEAPPTHAVIDSEGDVLGRGLSESAAICNAVARAHAQEVERHSELWHAAEGEDA